MATHTVTGKHIVLTTDIVSALAAILSVLPLDLFIDNPVRRMGPDAGIDMPPSGQELVDEVEALWGPTEAVARTDFYGEARKAFAVVQTLERRPYGNFLLQKGVVGPDGKDLAP